MRYPLTLIVTLLMDDSAPDLIRGRARWVASGDEETFGSLQELVACIRRAVEHPGKNPAYGPHHEAADREE